MCGIGGLVNFDYSKKEWESNLKNFCKQLHHRGPDAKGFFFDQENQIGLYQTRLSILDLNKRSDQPFFSKTKKQILIFNGEIYNYLKVKKDLKKNNIIFKTNSDTEVLFEAINFYGIKTAITKIDGMFAFAYLDLLNKKLYLARDRLGEKPLVYYYKNNQLIFSSEFKFLEDLFSRELSTNSLNSYLTFSNIPYPLSAYNNCYKKRPGEIIEIELTKKLNLKKNIYWEPSIYYFKNTIKKSSQNISIEAENILEEIINEQLNADVNVGTFLSGGYDSSLITLLSSKYASKKINSFSIGYDDASDESRYAEKVAKIIKTQHNTIILKPKDIEDNIGLISQVFDEPFSDISQIPNMLLSKFAKKHVSVVLTGDGGDEVFGGYYRHNFLNKIFLLNKNLPKFIKPLIEFALDKLSSTKYDNDQINRVGKIFGINSLQSKLDKFKNLINAEDKFELYFLTLSRNYSQKLDFNSLRKEYSIYEDVTFKDFIRLMDYSFYLNNDILTKVDRTSMYNSLEIRSPFLDRKIVEFSLQNLQFNKPYFENKFIIKKILSKYLDLKLFDRPKKGFSFPLHNWIYKELKNYFCDNLNNLKKKNLSNINNKNINNILESINKRKYLDIHQAWSLVVLNNWLETNEK